MAEFEQFALDSPAAHPVFSRSIHPINVTTVSSIGGRPVRFG